MPMASHSDFRGGYSRIVTNTYYLNESNVRLSTYTGEPIEVEGSTIVQMEHNDQSLVTKGDGPTLLGRDWLLLLRLDWTISSE